MSDVLIFFFNVGHFLQTPQASQQSSSSLWDMNTCPRVIGKRHYHTPCKNLIVSLIHLSIQKFVTRTHRILEEKLL